MCVAITSHRSRYLTMHKRHGNRTLFMPASAVQHRGAPLLKNCFEMPVGGDKETTIPVPDSLVSVTDDDPDLSTPQAPALTSLRIPRGVFREL